MICRRRSSWRRNSSDVFLSRRDRKSPCNLISTGHRPSSIHCLEVWSVESHGRQIPRPVVDFGASVGHQRIEVRRP